MKIQLCRTLLREFLCSAEPLLTTTGEMWVTLCAGQGGTGGDSVRRAWSDSWQLTEQAAAAGLLLRRLDTFRPELYPGYRPTGNRSRQERGFHTRRGVVHVLARGTPLEADRLPERLSAGHPRLLLDGAAVPLTHYWLRRLPPPAGTHAQQIVARLMAARPAGEAVTRRLHVRHVGKQYRAVLADAWWTQTRSRDDAGGLCDIRCNGESRRDQPPPDGVCVTMMAELDGEVVRGTDATPLRTTVTVSVRQDGAEDARPDARADCAALGLLCKVAHHDECEQLLASCGDRQLQLCVASTHTDGSRLITTYHVDRMAACRAGDDDWRHALRADLLRLQPLAVCSLHAPVYTFDLSFWLDGGPPVDTPFSWWRLCACLRAALGGLLVSLSSVDEYEEPSSGRRARTVRLQYQDLKRPLSREACRHLHLHVLPTLLQETLGVSTR